MGSKEAKEKKEKPLEKMTAKDLREMALGMEGIAGVHAMNKNELIAAIREAKGITEDASKQKTVDMRSLKAKVLALKEKKQQAKEAGNKKQADSLRRTISNLKKKMRRAG